MVEMCSHPATERAGVVTLRLPANAPLIYPTPADDAGLRRTLVVVVADHGEELGEDGRTDHTQSLADGVQHIPWIVAGSHVRPGQRSTRITENVDVVPTILQPLQLPLPRGVVVDGRPQIDVEGRICDACGKAAAYYAWEEYRAIRSRRPPAPPPDGRLGGRTMRRASSLPDHPPRTPLPVPEHARVAGTLERRIARRLDLRERTFRTRRYDAPGETFLVPATFWDVEGDAFRCVPVGPSTTRTENHGPGWRWSDRGLFVLGETDGLSPVRPGVDVPAPECDVDAAVVPVGRMPWFFGFSGWARKTFLRDTPTELVPLRRARSTDRLVVSLPPEAVRQRHVVALRLSPPGASPRLPSAGGPIDDEQKRRLRALGYVQ